MSLRKLAVDGMFWSMSSQFIRMILQFMTTIFLARLLDADQFGIYAMALPVIALANLLQDIGLNQSIIQKEKLEPEQASLLFWINLGLSTGLVIVLFVCAPLIADFYEEPRLVRLLEAWAFVLLVGALSFGQYAMLARKLRFRLLAIIDIICAITSFGVVMLMARVWPSYWALWFSGLASVCVWVALTWCVSGWRPQIPKWRLSLDGMFSFGAWIAGHNIANYLVRNLDNILIGRSFGAIALGFYDRAYKLLLYPVENLGNPISRVMVPILSRLQTEPQSYRRAYLHASGLLSLLMMPGMCVAIACAPELVFILLGDEWSSVADIFFWLGFAGLVQPLLMCSTWLFLAEGRGQDLMWVSLSSSLVISGAFFISLRWGAVGVATAYAFAEIFFHLPIQFFFAGRKIVSHIDLALDTLPNIVASMITFAVIAGLRHFDVTGGYLIGLSFVCAYVSGLGSMAAFPRGRLIFFSARDFLREACSQFNKRHVL